MASYTFLESQCLDLYLAVISLILEIFWCFKKKMMFVLDEYILILSTKDASRAHAYVKKVSVKVNFVHLFTFQIPFSSDCSIDQQMNNVLRYLQTSGPWCRWWSCSLCTTCWPHGRMASVSPAECSSPRCSSVRSGAGSLAWSSWSSSQLQWVPYLVYWYIMYW